MTLSEYSHLKQQVIIHVGSSEKHRNLLTTLKELFVDEINSPRRYESITTIGQLLNVLEIRDCLTEDHVDPLKKIAEKLPNYNALMTLIAHYEATHVPREYRNYYDTPNTTNRVFETTVLTNSPQGSMSIEKKQRIVQTIVEELGNAWRDLARNLHIRECEINDIDKNYKPLARKALRLMELYFLKKADNNWYFELCNALTNTRRKDLAKAVQKIAMMNL